MGLRSRPNTRAELKRREIDLRNGAGFTLSGMLSDLGAAGLLRAARRQDALSLSRAIFPIFVVGLACSVTLSESTLIVLTMLWLWRLRDPAAVSYTHLTLPTNREV